MTTNHNSNSMRVQEIIRIANQNALILYTIHTMFDEEDKCVENDKYNTLMNILYTNSQLCEALSMTEYKEEKGTVYCYYSYKIRGCIGNHHTHYYLAESKNYPLL